MKKLLVTIFLTFLIPLDAFAISLEENLNTLIQNSEVNKQAIVAVSIMDLKTGKTLYQRNSNRLLHPASNLKLFTTNLAFNILGENYNYKTRLYQKGNNLYLKLSGDPYLESKDLKLIFKNIQKGRYNLFIDDSEVDKSYYGTGWMWDNFYYKYFPKQSVYALNHNTIKIRVTPYREVISDYPHENFQIVKNNSKDYLIERKPWENNETIYISGNFRREKNFKIPVSNPIKHFSYQIEKITKEREIYLSHIGSTQAIPLSSRLRGEATRSLIEIISKTNKESDNFAAELLLKKVGKHSFGKGTTQNGLEVLKQFYDISKVEIVDGSGVSHNNLLNTSWIVQNLYTISQRKNFKKFKQTLAVPKQKGTLQYRLIPFKGKLFAKTGTISGVSGIEGYLKTKRKNVCFSILIQNYKGESKKAKTLEDEIIQTLSWY